MQLFQSQRDANDIKEGLSHLYMGSWEPHATNGASGASWGRKDDHGREGQSGVDQCWDKDGSIQPLHLTELTDDEREVLPLFSWAAPISMLTIGPRCSCLPLIRR